MGSRCFLLKELTTLRSIGRANWARDCGSSSFSNIFLQHRPTIFSDILSLGSVSTCLGCDGMFNDGFIAKFDDDIDKKCLLF